MTDDLMGDDDTPPVADPNKDYLVELVGEGRKFKSPQDLAKGKFESDQYIKILQKRLDEMRDDYVQMRDAHNNTKRMEDLIDQLSNKSTESTTPQRPEEHQPQYDSKQIESLVSSKIQEHEMTRQQTANFDLVKSQLRERFGPNFKERVQEQIEDLGITEKELNEMARRTPKVLLRTLGLDKKPEAEQFQSPPTSSNRSDSFQASGRQKRTWAYYQDLKKKDPKIYFDRQVAVQMQKDAMEQGDAFYDGNFYVKGLHEK